MAVKRIQLDEVLFEFTPVGHYIKVAAVDPLTRTEVSIVGDRRASQKELERIAIQKLRYVLERQAGSRPPRTLGRSPGHKTDIEA